MSERETPLPPPTFEFLVLSLRMQAEMSLGLGPEMEGAPPKDLRVARHFIDLLALLQDKCKGNLSLEEQRLLDNTVTELRFRFIQAQQEPQAPPVQNG
ncbi:MAG: DUF1844 domain-containing protein [Acidobacteria bacterium]|nr:DUF1844 domain-containing protein [Acidobacteriota bacterium]